MEVSFEDQIKYLQQAIKSDDAEEVYKIAYDLLNSHPDDSQYQQCLAIACIRLGKMQILPKTIFKQMPKTGGQLDKLYGYYLYSVGEYQKCMDVLKKLKPQLSLKLLMSQVYFKMMQYDESYRLMEELMKTEKLDLQQKQTYLVNLLATGYSQKSENIFKNIDYTIHKESCKELFYNYSLFLFQKNDIEGTKKYLTMFQQQLTKQDELDWITVKLFKEYISFHHDTNIEEYQNILLKNKEKNVRGVITNNLFFLKGHDEGLTDAGKQIDEMFDPSYKISKMQYIILKINKMSLLLRKNRFTEALRIIKDVEEICHPKFLMFNYDFIVNKYYTFKKTKEELAIKKLINQLLETGQNGLAFCLLADHIHDNQNIHEFFKTLNQTNKSDSSVIKNYIFSQLIRVPALFEQNSNKLDDLIRTTNDPKILEILLKVYQSKNNNEKQFVILKKILEINSKNTLAKTKMAKVALAKGHIQEAQQLLRGVQVPEQITDLSYLQYIQKNIHISVKKQEQELENKKEGHKKRIKKNKKPKLPKNIEKFIEGYKGDPERWLPKWQRKGYKKRGKKGGKTQGLATVGRQQKNVYTVGSSTSAKEVTKNQKKRR